MDPNAANDLENTLDAQEEVKEAPIFAPSPKKRGRKKSIDQVATTEKVELAAMPDEIIEILAIGPLLLGAMAAKQFTGYDLQYSNDALKACVPAFKIWLNSIDVELTPGVALLACYSLAISTTIPGIMAQIAEKESKAAQNANPVQTDNNRAGSESANPPQAIG